MHVVLSDAWHIVRATWCSQTQCSLAWPDCFFRFICGGEKGSGTELTRALLVFILLQALIV